MKYDACIGEAPETPAWGDVFELLKPGAPLVVAFDAFAYHRSVVAIEDAGFEIRDMLTWQRRLGAIRVVLARRPLEGTVAENVSKWGVGGLAIATSRIGTEGGTKRSGQTAYGASGWRTGHDIVKLETGRYPSNVFLDPEVAKMLPSAASFFHVMADLDAVMAHVRVMITPPGGATILDLR